MHWLTDAEFERTGLLPDNATKEPQNGRGPGQLPLRGNDCNRMTLTLAGDTVLLSLNGQPICERTLPPGNQRIFGLFHYKDATSVRVRNVTYRGDWPKELQPDALHFTAAK